MNNETLLKCDQCGRSNFTARGLVAHRCKATQPLDLVPSVKLVPAITDPILPFANDAEVADQLRAFIKEASDGLKRIIIAGLFIERIASQLKHGQLMPWVEAHCPDVSWRTVCRWRELARGVMDAIGIKSDTVSLLTIPPHEILRLPISELPEDTAPIRAKMDELLEGKTARQLFLNFAQTEDGEKPKVGRVTGSVGKPGVVDPEEQLRLAKENAATRLNGIHGDLLGLMFDDDITLGYIALPHLKKFKGALVDLQKHVNKLIKSQGRPKASSPAEKPASKKSPKRK